MDRIKINISSFKYPRIELEDFFFTKEEKESLNMELNILELMFPERVQSIFSISKQDGLYRGSLKINSSTIFTYGKDVTAIGLFCKLRERLKARVLEQKMLNS